MSNKETVIYQGDSKWSRNAYIKFVGDKIVFDCSDGEYGPIEFDIQMFYDAELKHAQDIDNDWDVTLMDGLENEPYVSDDFQIGPDGAYENEDEWDPDYMDGQNEDTWFDELDINPHWKKNLKRFNLSPEVWNVICRLHYGDTIALKQSMEEQLYWIQKYNNLKKNIKNLLD